VTYLPSWIPTLEEAIFTTKSRLYEKLGKICDIVIFVSPNNQVLDIIETIDHEKFREELWITNEELEAKTRRKGFIAFLIYFENQPIAFLYGYQNPENTSGFYLDEVATRIEGKGVGKILIVLSLIYCVEAGYTHITLYTENSDEKGRRLKEFYEHIGFQLIENENEYGILMRYDINKEKLLPLYNRIMIKEGGPFPPFLAK
jgi:GNAT superfamily N-acetyltransferase